MSVLVPCIVALLASGLTFFSGFGLGTLLLPAFALFYPVAQAVALTAIVHFLNGLFKLLLVGRHADLRVVLLFGLPAIAASFLGAWSLMAMAQYQSSFTYGFLGMHLVVTPLKLVIGLLLLAFAALELLPDDRAISFAPRYLPLGGVLSGFFGGLSGMQGALRSAFLVRAGLDKQAFIATGAVLASLIDIVRLGVYAYMLADPDLKLDYQVVAPVVLAAFAGAALGNRFLRKVTMKTVQRIVALMLAAVALGLILGLL